jgi:hypothetical protein
VNRLRRVTGGSLAVVCALLALLPACASAAISDPLSWSQPAQIAGGPPFTYVNDLQAVSCPSTSLCVGVDNGGGAVATANPTAGTPAWGPHQGIDAGRTLNSISCVAGTTTCAAVDQSGYVVVTSDAGSGNPTWSRPDPIDSGHGLNSISCASTSLCAATDNAGNAFTSTDPFASSPTWHEQTDVDPGNNLESVSCPATATAYCVAVTSGGYAVITDDPTDASPTWTPSAAAIAPADMTSVSCVSTTLCVAVDNLGTAVETGDPTDTSTPPMWSTAAPIEGTSTNTLFSISCTSAVCAAVDDEGDVVVSTTASEGPANWSWTTPQQLPSGGVLFGASCVSSTVCVVVGSLGGGPQTFFNTTPTDTTTWTGVVANGFNYIVGVSCPPGAGFCAALDSSDRVEVTDDPGAAIPKWTPSAVLESPRESLTAISCADANLCVVTDVHGQELYSTNPTAATPTWSPPVAMGDGTSSVYSVDCPADNLCVATDGNSNALVSRTPNSSSTWTSVSAKHGALSCAGTSMCMIVEDSSTAGNGYVRVLTDLTAPTPTVTSDPNPIDTSSAPSAVACPSTTLCVVGDDSGNVLVSSDPEDASPTFSSPEPVDPNKDITALSCPSTSLCVAGDPNGLVAMTTDPAGTSVPWSTTQVFGIFNNIDAISCASTQLCAAGDNFGNASIGLPPPTYALTVATAGTGSGTVSGGAISCPGTCSESFTAGQTVSLTAVPASGSTFAGWSGGGCSGTGTCSVTVSAATTVTATFDMKVAPPPPKLTCTLKLKSTKVALPPSKKKKHAKPVKNAGTFAATATCNQAAKGTVSGTVTEAASKKKPKHGKKTFKLSSVKVSLSAGKAATVTIKLPSGALKALAAKASESASLKLGASGGSVTATASGKLR